MATWQAIIHAPEEIMVVMSGDEQGRVLQKKEGRGVDVLVHVSVCLCICLPLSLPLCLPMFLFFSSLSLRFYMFSFHLISIIFQFYVHNKISIY